MTDTPRTQDIVAIESAFLGPFKVKCAKANNSKFPEGQWLVPLGRDEGQHIKDALETEDVPLMWPVAAWEPIIGKTYEVYLRGRGRIAEVLPNEARQCSRIVDALTSGLGKGNGFNPKPRKLDFEIVFHKEGNCLRGRHPKTGQYIYGFGIELTPDENGEVKIGPESGYHLRGCYYRTFFVLMTAELAAKVSETTLSMMDDEQRFAEAMTGDFYGVRTLAWQLVGDPTKSLIDLSSFRFDAMGMANKFEKEWLEDKLANLQPRFIIRWLTSMDVETTDDEKDELVRLAMTNFDLLENMVEWFRDWVDFTVAARQAKESWTRHLMQAAGLTPKPTHIKLPPPPSNFKRTRVKKMTELTPQDLEAIVLAYIKDWLKAKRTPIKVVGLKVAPKTLERKAPVAKKEENETAVGRALAVAQEKKTKGNGSGIKTANDHSEQDLNQPDEVKCHGCNRFVIVPKGWYGKISDCSQHTKPKGKGKNGGVRLIIENTPTAPLSSRVRCPKGHLHKRPAGFAGDKLETCPPPKVAVTT